MKENPVHIEEILAHHESQIQDLSDMVAKQWKLIDSLQDEIKLLKDKIGALKYSDNESGGENLSVTEQALRDKPPHY